MKSLKKIVRAINPKREFAAEKQERTKQETLKSETNESEKKKWPFNDVCFTPKSAKSIWEERMRKYYGANIVPFNSHASRWNSCQDLIEEQRIIDKKAVRERIKNRVLSSVHQALENKIDEIFSYCESKEFNIKGKLNLKPSKYKLSRQTVEQEFVTTYECVEFRKRELPDIIAHFREALGSLFEICFSNYFINKSRLPYRRNKNYCVVQAQVCEISFFLLQKYEEMRGP